MSENEPNDAAALLALGVLDGEEHGLATRRLHRDPAFAADVEAWEARLAPLARHVTPIAPPDDLLARIEHKIAARAAPLPMTRTVRAGDGKWHEIAPGVRVRVLSKDTSRNRNTLEMVMDPGGVYVDHDHDDDEEIYVLSGDLAIGDHVLHAGDFHVASKGGHHPAARSINGCRCLIITPAG